MQYSVKTKLNKLDTVKYRNLRVEEIDFKLNEAQTKIINALSEPRYKKLTRGLESNQRNFDDLRNLIVYKKELGFTLKGSDIFASLPKDYKFFMSSFLKASKEGCNNTLRVHIRQHDDKHESNTFYKTDFNWGEVTGMFIQNGLLLRDLNFNVEKVYLTYIRVPKYIHNASSVVGGSYKNINGVILEGSQDCELSEHLHEELVDLAVSLMISDIEANFKFKEQINNINK